MKSQIALASNAALPLQLVHTVHTISIPSSNTTASASTTTRDAMMSSISVPGALKENALLSRIDAGSSLEVSSSLFVY